MNTKKDLNFAGGGYNKINVLCLCIMIHSILYINYKYAGNRIGRKRKETRETDNAKSFIAFQSAVTHDISVELPLLAQWRIFWGMEYI